MAAGASIVTNVPTVGSTVDTLDKIRDLEYSKMLTVASNDVPLRLSLRASTLGSLARRFGGTLKLNPQVLDVPTATSKGRITITLNVDAYLGSEMDPADIVLYTRYFMGAMLKSTLLEGLRDGSAQ